jgi:iron complex outermembrane recepter protein
MPSIAEAYTPSMNGHYFVTDTNFASRQFGIVTFLVGVFYLNGAENFDINGFRLLSPNLPPAPKVETFDLQTYQRLAKEIIAGYAEVTIQPTEQLFLTVGGRYTEERQRGFSDFSGPNVLAFPGNPLTFKEFTPRFTARYAVTNDANVYASWSKGFKSGGINLSDFTLAPFRPEKITAYEVGFKGRIAPGLRLNLAGFYYDYKDVQIVQFAPPVYFEENAAEARIKGIDADISWTVSPDFSISAGAAWLDATYRNAEATVFIPNGAGNTTTPGVDISGNRLIRAPKFTGNIALNYSHETNAGRFGAYAGAYYNSGFAMEVGNRIRQNSFATLDAELSFEPASMKGLRLVVWGKNMTDKAYLASLLQTDFADGVSYAEPRTFGVRAEFSF